MSYLQVYYLQKYCTIVGFRGNNQIQSLIEFVKELFLQQNLRL